jgi:hypothetical protein
VTTHGTRDESDGANMKVTISIEDDRAVTVVTDEQSSVSEEAHSGVSTAPPIDGGPAPAWLLQQAGSLVQDVTFTEGAPRRGDIDAGPAPIIRSNGEQAGLVLRTGPPHEDMDVT